MFFDKFIRYIFLIYFAQLHVFVKNCLDRRLINKNDYYLNHLNGIKLKIGDLDIPFVKLNDEQVISLKFFWLTGVGKKEIANFLIDRKIDPEVIKKIEYQKTVFANGLSVESSVIRVKLVVSS